MYALAHNGRVLAGPMGWNRAIFDGNLQKLKITATLPKVAPTELPFVIDENTAVYAVEFREPEYNKKINYLEGPYYVFEDNKAIATYLVKEQPLDFVKGNLKQLLADERWKKEVAGIKVTIREKELSVSTARGERDIFLQKYSMMVAEETVDWKFPEGWFTLTKDELGTIVAAVIAHIQDAFNWEYAKTQEIDNCGTLEEVDAIVIVEPAQPLV